MGFIEQLRARWQASNSLVCVGLDPDPAKFPSSFDGDDDAIFEFCRDIVDATAAIRLRVQAADRLLRRARRRKTHWSG